MRRIEDHTPSRYPQDLDATLLLSFDEWAEIKEHDWIREATAEEIRQMVLETDSWDVDRLEYDATGRPYLWVTVLRTAPGHIWRQATGHVRIHRFREEG